MSGRLSIGVVASLLVSTLFACSWGNGDGEKHDDDNFRADVIECEDALSRLERCCPSFDSGPVLCNYYYDYSSGCSTTTTDSTEPAITTAESSCIRDTACDALVANKVCERAQAARAYTRKTSTSSSSSTSGSYGTGYGSTTSQTHKPVCP